jgi:hypothetical protein
MGAGYRQRKPRQQWGDQAVIVFTAPARTNLFIASIGDLVDELRLLHVLSETPLDLSPYSG